jgi:hypothetical protein
MLLAVLATLNPERRSLQKCCSEAISGAAIELSQGLPGSDRDGGKVIASIAVDRAIPGVPLPPSHSLKIANAYPNLQS